MGELIACFFYTLEVLELPSHYGKCWRLFLDTQESHVLKMEPGFSVVLPSVSHHISPRCHHQHCIFKIPLEMNHKTIFVS